MESSRTSLASRPRGQILKSLALAFSSPWPWPWPRGLKSRKLAFSRTALFFGKLKFCGALEKFFGKRFFVHLLFLFFIFYSTDPRFRIFFVSLALALASSLVSSTPPLKIRSKIFTIGVFACIYIALIRDFDVQRFD